MNLKKVYLSLTSDCTQKCVMCKSWKWMEEEENKKRKILQKEEIIKLLEDLKKIGIHTIVFTGGEPTIREDFCELVAIALEQNFNLQVVTNGTILGKKKKLQEFLSIDKIKSDKFILIVSFLGADPGTHDKHTLKRGSFKKAVELIKTLLKEEIKIGIFYTLLPGNYHQILKILQFTVENQLEFIRYGFLHGYQDIYFSKEDIENLIPYLNTLMVLRKKKELRNLYPYVSKIPHVMIESSFYKELIAGNITEDDLKNGTLARSVLSRSKIFCRKCTNSCRIDHFGNVYPCYNTYFNNEDFKKHYEQRKLFNMGNIREQSMIEILEGEKYKRFLEKVSPIQISDPNLYTACVQCIECIAWAH